ncbi:RinA family protein [Weissella confusa]|uniref:RinA family protein n=1 Tax=Weissella confusa TaxID=1583 RepID=UPI001C6F8236|nr:RinA family protein [Weissella confusa]QYU58199.1 RinA family protein [Weissella confusa]
MADRVDKVLNDYFTGNLDRKIRMRVAMINTANSIDENVGGGRAQYKYSNAVENKLISEENDAILRAIRHNKKVIDTWTQEMDEVRYDVIREIYLRRKTWVDIGNEYGVSRTTMNEWRNDLKKSIAGWGLLLPY